MSQTNVMSALETTKEDSAEETIDEDSRRYDYFSRELFDRTKYRTGNWNLVGCLDVRLLTAYTCAWKSVHTTKVIWCAGDLSVWFSQYEPHDVFAGTPTIQNVQHVDRKSSQSHKTQNTGVARSSQSWTLRGCILSRRHGRGEKRTSTSRCRARSHCRVVVDQSSLRKAESYSFVVGVSAP